ncbi:MAG: ClcB-like voltage-gated chloride channel protein [Chthoniobacterales bacterium]
MAVEAQIPPTPIDPENARMRRIRWLLPLMEWLRPRELQITLFLAGLVGFLGALGALGFRAASKCVQWAMTRNWTSDLTESFGQLPWWERIIIPAAGGAIAGLVLMATTRFLKQKNTTDYMEAVVIGDGVISSRQSLLKSLSALFSISSGGSIGREGPLVQIAVMVGSGVGRIARVSRPRLRLLVACGASAGIAAAYNAPISGALFVAEIVLGTMSMEIFGPLIFSSVVATLTTRQFIGGDSLYHVTHLGSTSPSQLIAFLLLGCVCGLLSPLYLRTLHSAESLFSKWNAPLVIRMAAGGLIVGCIAAWYPEVCGNGYSSLTAVLHGDWLWKELLIILLLKVVATSATFGSGAVGGVFTPTLFVGSGIGYLFGSLLHAFPSTSGIQPIAFALIGMGAFLAASTRAPIMAIVMIFEITLDYEMILPLMLGCVVAYYMARSLSAEGIYSEALRRKGRWEFDSELRRMRVGDIMKKNPPTVDSSTAFAEVCEKFASLRHNYLYVLDSQQRFVGVISLHDIKRYLNDPDLAKLIIARDITRENFPTLLPDDQLTTVFERFSRHEGERIPVLSATGSGKLEGSVSKADALLAFAEKPEMRSAES